MRPLGSAEFLERRRERAIGLLQEGYPPVEVARRVGVDRRSVRRWKAVYRQRGRAGLRGKPPTGRPRKLTSRHMVRFEKLLLRGARAAGFDTDLWTCPRVAHLVQQQFGIGYHVDHICRLLHRLGWSPQKPTRVARERDDQQIQGWIKQQWPRIKKSPSTERLARVSRRKRLFNGPVAA